VILTLLGAAHEGEEVAIILPAIMLVGAFFVLRWANKNDAERAEELKSDGDGEFVASLARPDGDETTR
jgi:hypothetical protein